MTLYMLKVHLQMFLSILITQKCHILSCDTLVANERYVIWSAVKSHTMKDQFKIIIETNKQTFIISAYNR